MGNKKSSTESKNLNKIAYMNSSIRNFNRYFIMYLFFNHLAACFWFFQAKMQDFPDGCWVRDKGLHDDSVFRQYIVSFYWSF